MQQYRLLGIEAVLIFAAGVTVGVYAERSKTLKLQEELSAKLRKQVETSSAVLIPPIEDEEPVCEIEHGKAHIDIFKALKKIKIGGTRK